MRFLPFRHLLIGALALAALSSVAAGCGGGSPSAGVANVGTTTGTADSSDSSSGGGSGRDADGKNPAKFSACMRSHGVPNFPDPGSDGGINIGPNNGINPNSATFKAAEKACQKELHIRPPSQAEQQRMQEEALRFSRCMREHGLAKFPDPQFSGGRATLKLDRHSGIDPSSPLFKSAQKACAKLIPGMTNRVGPGGSGGGGGAQTESNGGPAS